MAYRLARSRLTRAVRVLSIALPVGAPVIGRAQLARAEEPEPSAPPSAAAAPAQAPRVEPDEPLERARAASAIAERLFSAGQYSAALAEYSRAYEILNGHPRQYYVLHNLAACNERLFRYDLAVQLYEEYLRRAPPTEDDRREVGAVLETLRSLLATLVVESSVAGEAWLDDRRLGSAPGEWRVPAGRHIVQVRAVHYESQQREVQLSPGQREVDRFQLQRVSVNVGPPPGYFWAAVGLTGASAIVGATAGFKALSAREQGRKQAALYLDTQEDGARTRRWALTSDVGFGAAALFGATATVLYFVTDWQPARAPERRARAPRSLAVALTVPGGLGATVLGKF